MRTPAAPQTSRKPGGAPAGRSAPPARLRLSPLQALEPVADPIDESRYPGDPEGDAKEELSQLETGFRERMKAEADRYKAATTVDYFFCVVLNSGEQAEALMRGLGVRPDKLYVDGRVIAQRLGIELPPDLPIEPVKTRRNPALVALVRKPAPRK